MPEPHNQQACDLFIGEVTGAWADARAFRDGHWLFESADPAWRSIHHVAGAHFHAIGKAMRAARNDWNPRRALSSKTSMIGP